MEQPYVGIGGGYGLSTPDFSRVIPAFDIPYYRIDRLDGINETIDEVINHKGPVFCEVVVDWHQNFAPKSSSKVLPDGKIVSAAVVIWHHSLTGKNMKAIILHNCN